MKKKNKSSLIGKTCMLVCVLLLASCVNLTHATSPKYDADKIAHYVCDKLSYDEDNLLFYVWGPVSQGDTIRGTKEHIFDVPCPGYVIYIDLHPLANLFHPVQYVFLSESTLDVFVFDASSPPLNFYEYQIVDTAFAHTFLSAENRRAPIPSGMTPSTRSQDTRWAVLMNGGYDSGNNHVRYWNDLSNIYITINYVYGIPDENIIVLCSDGLNSAPDQSNGQNSDPDLDGDGDDDIMYSCVLTNVDAVFASLAANFTNSNKLFVFTTDHGNTAGGQNVVENLWNHEELSDAHFASLLEAFPECEKICTFEPCFSGGFLDNVVVPPGPIVASSSCRYDEYSWAMDNLIYDEYVFYWTAAVKGEDAFGNPVDADANQDGVITMDEAYLYAKAHDTASESPQYGEYPENLGSTLSLWVSNLPPENLSRPTGPDDGITGREYSFSTNATDPEGTDVFYQFDWGEGNISNWYGPYTSGANGTGKYTWGVEGSYAVRAKAKDADGIESGWSDPHNITIYALPTLSVLGIFAKKGQLNVTIKNTGTVNVTSFNWSITLNGGFILRGKESTGASSQQLNVGLSTNILSDSIFGLGKPTITVKVETQEQHFYRTWTAKVILFFVFYFQ